MAEVPGRKTPRPKEPYGGATVEERAAAMRGDMTDEEIAARNVIPETAPNGDPHRVIAEEYYSENDTFTHFKPAHGEDPGPAAFAPVKPGILREGKKITDRIPIKLGIEKMTVNEPDYWGLASVMTEELLEGIKKLVKDRQIGVQVVVEGGQPLTTEGLGPMKSPGGLVFDGKHAGDVKTWKECYQRLCQKLNEIDAAKFDGLPDDEFFCKWFKREEPKLPGQKRAKKCTGCYPDKLGSKPDVRAVEVSGKAYFCDEDKIVHRLLAHFGIDANRVAVRPK